MSNELLTRTISSREVAEMMEIAHAEILRKLDGRKDRKGIVAVLTESQMVVSDYFIQSEYKDSSGKANKEYLCTKLGCEFLANKFTGEKGILFTAKYVKKFNDMEQHIKQQLDSYMITDPIERAKRWIEEQQEKQLLVMQNEEMKPKALAYDKFMEADGTYTTTNACKMLGLSRKKVFESLREKGLVYKKKAEATQKAIDKGLFKQVLKNGYSTMVITPKGIDYLKDLAI